MAMKKIEPKTQSKKVEFYKFIQDWKISGLSISSGVVLKGDFKVTDDCISLVGSTVFKSIPLEYVEKFEPVKYQKKPRKNKKIEAKEEIKTGSDSARISSRADMLKD